MDCPIDISSIHKDVILFSLDNCKKCLETKAKLDTFKVKYQEINLEVCRLALLDKSIKVIEVAPTIILKKDGGVKIII